MIWEGFAEIVQDKKNTYVVSCQGARVSLEDSMKQRLTEHDTAAEWSDGGTRIGHMLAQVFNMRPPQRKVT